jgi:hypothetical protein
MNYKTDSRPQRYSWAPGGYVHTCISCKDGFTGDKRAMLCADCAYALPDPTPKPPVKEGEQVKGKYRYEWLADGSHKIIGPDGPIAETYASYIKGESELRAQTIINALNSVERLEGYISMLEQSTSLYDGLTLKVINRIVEQLRNILASQKGKAE